MGSFVMPVVLGILIAALGICNMRGNINSIHWYHRQRVAEEDKKAFGKLMGLGTILCGSGIILFGIASLIAEITKVPVFITLGSAALVLCLIIGLGTSLYAMLKYNKGIF